ncbi:ABC transporter ATP-binding protein [Pusillimonas sp.]|uniref:ABC transporter ATP-binding protein n=1 Tax=Pusillimonas sp. TaxID=3040095 RepID=UPI0029B5433A|nr:ABC transporter ATP-binding protein [Pusillimonas sp.]MDX3894265.1 ABC transporter ATP-binding protein [Pusillimonas sp.]
MNAPLESLSAGTASGGRKVLTVDDLCVEILSDEGAMLAVKRLGLALRLGQTFALVGESGCGKSMTALALLRLLPEAGRMIRGEVMLDGTDLGRLPESDMRSVRGGKIGIVFQEPSTSLNPVLTVGRQIVETLQTHTPHRGAAARRKAIEWLQRVGIEGAERRFHDYPFQFSGGQKQRIMIAIALAAEPRVLIADEPTTALDVTVQAQILELLADIQKEMGLAILLITHDLAVVSKVADHVALMRHGEIVETVPARQFFSAARHPYARQLLAAIPTYGKRGKPLTTVESDSAHRSDAARATASESANDTATTRAMESAASISGGGDADETARAARPATPSAGEPVLRVRNLCVSYRARGGLFSFNQTGVDVVSELSLDLYRGETLALLGESGCGKTTAAKALLRLLEKQARVSGSVTLAGQSVLDAGRAGLKRVRGDMQIVFQDPYASLDPRMQVGDILEEGVAALRPDLSRQRRRHRVRQLLDRVGLPSGAVERYPHEFSGGQRQRIAIARALAVEPKVLLCDEPTSALDVSVQAQLLELLQQLQRDSGMAYLFITHNFGVVEYLSDRIAVMHEGRIVETGETGRVLHHPTHEQTRRLLAAVPRL